MAHKPISKVEHFLMDGLASELERIENDRKIYQSHLDKIPERIQAAKKSFVVKATANCREVGLIAEDEEITGFDFENGKCVAIHHEKAKKPEVKKPEEKKP